MYRIIIALIVLVLGGCATNNRAQLLPADTEYLRTTGGGFMLHAGKPMYAMNYLVKKPLPDGSIVRVIFENPEDPNEPYIKEAELKDHKVAVRSDPINAIKNRNNYRVLVEIIVGSEVISFHEQYVRFEMPDEFLEQLGVNTI